MQVLDMMNSVATGGEFVPPRLVQGVVQPDGSVRALGLPRAHRVLTPVVTSALTGMLEQVVSDGTAPGAAIPGYTVAGKTGTAQIPNTKAPGYVPGAYMATFTGFAPAQNPALSAIVVLNKPTPIFGGAVAAPVFSKVMSYALQRYGVPPSGLASTGLTSWTSQEGQGQEGEQGGTGLVGATGAQGVGTTVTQALGAIGLSDGLSTNSDSVVAGTAPPSGSPGTIAQSAGQNARSP